jgi:hypothetical protein
MAAIPPPDLGPHTSHTGHLLLAAAFTVVSLAAVAGVEALQRRRREGRPTPSLTAIIIAVAGASSAAIHGAVLPSHWREAVTYGLFFLGAAVAQLGLSIAVMLVPARRWLQANALVNIGLLGVWLQSRTVGVPIGPLRGVAEPVGVLDVISSACELLVVVAVVKAVRHRRARGVLAAAA